MRETSLKSLLFLMQNASDIESDIQVKDQKHKNIDNNYV